MKIVDWIIGGIKARLMKLEGLAGTSPNMDRISDTLWVGGANNPGLVISECFEAVLDLRETDTSEYRTILEESGLEYLNLRIPDREGGSPEVLSRVAEWIRLKVQNGKKVLVHCNLGRGRATLAVAAYMVFEGSSPEEALRELKEKRPVTFLNDRQARTLHKFFEKFSSTAE